MKKDDPKSINFIFHEFDLYLGCMRRKKEKERMIRQFQARKKMKDEVEGI